MILLIYREEVYDKNTTKKGIAEIDLAKHRNGETGTFLSDIPGRVHALRELRAGLLCRRRVEVSRLIRAVIDTSRAASQPQRDPRARAGRKVIAVVKANAYGHGLVSAALAHPGADAFAVARLEEGMTLRAAGITSADRAARGRLQSLAARGRRARPASSSWSTTPARSSCSRVRRPRALRDLAQGRHRHEPPGLLRRRISAALERLRSCEPAPREIRLMTHLACADERDGS